MSALSFGNENPSWVFREADQQRFAALSGDHNPMHMDRVAARLTVAGAPVVHGVHALLRSLDALAGRGQPLDRLRAVRAQFSKFIFLDRNVELRVAKRDEVSARASLIGEDETPLLTMSLSFGTRDSAPEAEQPSRIEMGRAPLEPAFEDMAGMSGALSPPAGVGAFAPVFPRLCQAIGEARVAGLSLFSTVVGMLCPGAHSVFDALDVRLVEGGGSDVWFRTRQTNPRFRTVQLDVGGAGLAGQLSAFERPRQHATESMELLSTLVRPGEFAHVRAFVIGGSRGLGATTAKLLAAGGARVAITFAHGRDEAEAVAAEIAAARGDGVCAVHRVDVAGPIAPQLGDVAEASHLYYYATPRIFRQKSPRYDPALFAEFSRAYIDAFEETVRVMLGRTAGPLRVLYPSSIAVDERPEGITEYAMAKAAGEQLCRDLVKLDSRLKISVSRLPRVRTDQTATIVPTAGETAADVMLPLIRELG